MLRKFELNHLSKENQMRALKIFSGIIVILLLIGVSAAFLNNVIATPISPRDMAIRGWVSDLGDAGLTAKRHSAESHLEEAGQDAVPALTTALHSNDVNVRQNAAEVLGYIASPNAADALRQSLLNDPVPGVRANAAWALGEIKNAATLPLLESASVLDTSATVRENANASVTNIQNALVKRAGRSVEQVNVVAVAPNQTNTIYLASQNDLLVSHDNGTQWTTLKASLPGVTSALAVNPTNPNILYAGMHSQGLYLSTDGGQTWQSLTHNFSNEAIGSSTVTAITIDPSNPMRVVMAHGIRVGDTGNEFFPLGILFSNDGGKTWGNVMDLSDGQLVTRLQVQNGKVNALTDDRVLIAPLS